MMTVAPASGAPSGTPGVDAFPLARLVPNKEMMEPGASGTLAAKLAPLAAAASTGAGETSPRPPVITRVPLRFCEALVAVTVRVTGPEPVPDCQVLCHMPDWSGSRLSGGAPFENETLTLPLLSVLPQSSRTTDSSATGHAAGTPKDWPSVVMMGTSWVGVHPAVAWGSTPAPVSAGA